MEYIGLTNIENYSNKELFQMLLPRVNIVTPYIISYEKVKISNTRILICEVSYGEGISGNGIWGVSIVSYEKNECIWHGKPEIEMGDIFESKDGAYNYIELLKQQ